VSARSGERPRLVTRLRSRSRKQSGFVIVFVAFNLTLLLILAAICVDLGNAYWSAQKLQKAADAGASAERCSCLMTCRAPKTSRSRSWRTTATTT
jgi:uncharacterized membrane protein